mmetsp:Transcript_12520/g.22374  ORF Transcript_12520/g.22374 Transcript_12520/m.22374 type:complete len:87 (+) Transcript_12520:351-611(+)
MLLVSRRAHYLLQECHPLAFLQACLGPSWNLSVWIAICELFLNTLATSSLATSSLAYDFEELLLRLGQEAGGREGQQRWVGPLALA